MTERRISVLCWAGLVVFTLYLLVVNRDYYHADTQVPSYDEAWYLETSLHLYHRLTDGGLAEFLDAYRRAFGVKAPLLSVLPLPFYLLCGASRESAMLVNSLFVVLANLYLFLLVRRLYSPSAGLAAVVYYQTMPLACGLSRSFMVEYGLAALVLMFFYYLVASDGLTRRREDITMGVLLGLGLLLKVLFAAFVAGPLVLALYQRRSWRPVPAIFLPALAIASTWYAFHLKSLLAFAFESAYGGIAPDYGAGGLRVWLLLFVNQGTSFYYAAALLVLGSLALALRPPVAPSPRPPAAPSPAPRAAAAPNPQHPTPASRAPAAFLLAWLLPPLLALAAGRNHLIRFVLPLLPVFAIGLAVAVFSLGRRWWLQAAVAVALAVFPQRLFAAVSYPSHDPSGHTVTWGPFVVYARDLGWARPPVREDPWEHRRLLEALRRLAPDADRPFYVVLALDHIYLNANLLNYLNAYQNYPLRFTSLGYGESSLDRALERIYSLDARFLIVGEGFRGLPGFLNRLNDDIRARLDRGELPFRRRAEVALASPMTVTLYEREAPWSRPTVPPSHPLPADFRDGVRFLGYDWKRRDRGPCEVACYWATSRRVGQDYRVEVELRRGDRLLAAYDYFLASYDWQPSQVARHSRTLYLPPDASDSPLEAHLWLVPWGVGPRSGDPLVLRLGP